MVKQHAQGFSIQAECGAYAAHKPEGTWEITVLRRLPQSWQPAKAESWFSDEGMRPLLCRTFPGPPVLFLIPFVPSSVPCFVVAFQCLGFLEGEI